MFSFLQRFDSQVIGVLSGFDRLRFRGTKRLLNTRGGMLNFLWHKRILLKDFKAYACSSTDSLRRCVEAAAVAAGRRVLFLNHRERKEDLARVIAQRDGITEGLIAVFSAVESCFSYCVHPDRPSKRLVLRGGTKKCLHYYHYHLDLPQRPRVAGAADGSSRHRLRQEGQLLRGHRGSRRCPGSDG